jgi:hypothetical protein
LENKDYYKDQKVSVLLDHLELPIDNYLWGPDDPMRMLVNSVTLNFFSTSKYTRKIENQQDAGLLIIQWEKWLPVDSVSKIISRNEGVWSKEEKKLFGEQTIINIQKMHYYGKKQ